MFLDCSIQKFDFGNPSSCIVMGPDKSAHAGANGAFTQAMIKVLSEILDKQQPLNYMTVQSFSYHVQASIQSRYDEILVDPFHETYESISAPPSTFVAQAAM